MHITKETIQVAACGFEAVLYVALPESYQQTTQRYPVLYMHDGHNLFFPEDSYQGETWRVAETFGENADLPDTIVVGVSAPREGIDRLDVYGPDPFTIEMPGASRQPGGKADAYLDWLVGTLKPIIDARYRTKPEADHTAVIGASMGGILSLYALLKHPEVFTRAASVSGAYFVALEPMLKRLENAQYNHVRKLYLDVGDHESAPDLDEAYLFSNQAIYERLLKHIGPAVLQYRIIAGGEHHERDWASRLADILRFVLM
ncbi:MAG: alpha/beta hydrolase [Acholeplasmatales bacterium]|nr:MAG: alpha/beta hydrolase [Acholeplasmatales bacterium]